MLAGMSVPLTLLGLLEREPSHGYDLKRDYDAFFGRGKPLPFGQVYSTLARLARDGKIAVCDVEPGEGPDRKRYVITDVGVTEFETWLRQPVEAEPHLQTVLFTKVVLALMLGRPACRTAAGRAPTPGPRWLPPAPVQPSAPSGSGPRPWLRAPRRGAAPGGA